MNNKSKETKKYLDKIPSWFRDGTESVLYNILGNLIPIWFVFGVSLYENGFDKLKIYEAIHQPYTFLILSATYITSTFYILNRKGNFYNHKYFSFFFIVLLMIIGYVIKDRKSLEDLSASFHKELFIVIIFLFAFIFYIYYEYRSHKNIDEADSKKESAKQYDELKDQYKNFKEDE